MSDCKMSASELLEAICETCSTKKRCERLEQVVRDMYAALVHCSGGCSGGCPLLNDGCELRSGELKERLDEIGIKSVEFSTLCGGFCEPLNKAENAFRKMGL